MTTMHDHDHSPARTKIDGSAQTLKKGKGPLTVGLAMLACVVACAAPLLLAGGLTAGLGALFTGSEVLPVAILAATAAGAYFWWRRKKAAAKALAAGGAGGSCGCGSGGC